MEDLKLKEVCDLLKANGYKLNIDYNKVESYCVRGWQNYDFTLEELVRFVKVLKEGVKNDERTIS